MPIKLKLRQNPVDQPKVAEDQKKAQKILQEKFAYETRDKTVEFLPSTFGYEEAKNKFKDRHEFYRFLMACQANFYGLDVGQVPVPVAPYNMGITDAGLEHAKGNLNHLLTAAIKDAASRADMQEEAKELVMVQLAGAYEDIDTKERNLVTVVGGVAQANKDFQAVLKADEISFKSMVDEVVHGKPVPRRPAPPALDILAENASAILRRQLGKQDGVNIDGRCNDLKRLFQDNRAFNLDRLNLWDARRRYLETIAASSAVQKVMQDLQEENPDEVSISGKEEEVKDAIVDLSAAAVNGRLDAKKLPNGEKDVEFKLNTQSAWISRDDKFVVRTIDKGKIKQVLEEAMLRYGKHLKLFGKSEKVRAAILEEVLEVVKSGKVCYVEGLTKAEQATLGKEIDNCNRKNEAALSACRDFNDPGKKKDVFTGREQVRAVLDSKVRVLQEVMRDFSGLMGGVPAAGDELSKCTTLVQVGVTVGSNNTDNWRTAGYEALNKATGEVVSFVREACGHGAKLEDVLGKVLEQSKAGAHEQKELESRVEAVAKAYKEMPANNDAVVTKFNALTDSGSSADVASQMVRSNVAKQAISAICAAIPMALDAANAPVANRRTIEGLMREVAELNPVFNWRNSGTKIASLATALANANVLGANWAAPDGAHGPQANRVELAALGRNLSAMMAAADVVDLAVIQGLVQGVRTASNNLKTQMETVTETAKNAQEGLVKKILQTLRVTDAAKAIPADNPAVDRKFTAAGGDVAVAAAAGNPAASRQVRAEAAIQAILAIRAAMPRALEAANVTDAGQRETITRLINEAEEFARQAAKNPEGDFDQLDGSVRGLADALRDTHVLGANWTAPGAALEAAANRAELAALGSALKKMVTYTNRNLMQTQTLVADVYDASNRLKTSMETLTAADVARVSGGLNASSRAELLQAAVSMKLVQDGSDLKAKD